MDYTVQVAAQLAPIIKGFRQANGLSQAQLAQRLGISQKRLSVIENHPERATFVRLMSLLGALGVDLVLRPRSSAKSKKTEW
jgi:HTH-type transcriptional regulator / antitoxin HipB